MAREVACVGVLLWVLCLGQSAELTSTPSTQPPDGGSEDSRSFAFVIIAVVAVVAVTVVALVVNTIIICCKHRSRKKDSYRPADVELLQRMIPNTLQERDVSDEGRGGEFQDREYAVPVRIGRPPQSAPSSNHRSNQYTERGPPALNRSSSHCYADIEAPTRSSVDQPEYYYADIPQWLGGSDEQGASELPYNRLHHLLNHPNRPLSYEYPYHEPEGSDFPTKRKIQSLASNLGQQSTSPSRGGQQPPVASPGSLPPRNIMRKDTSGNTHGRHS